MPYIISVSAFCGTFLVIVMEMGMSYNVTINDLIRYREQGIIRHIERIWQNVCSVPMEMLDTNLLDQLTGDIFIVWDADLIDVPMLLIPNDGEWLLLVDKSVTDFEDGVPREVAQNIVLQLVLHEAWHFCSKKSAIELTQWHSLLDENAFEEISYDEDEEKLADFFKMCLTFGNPDDFRATVESLKFNIDEICQRYKNAAPEDAVKYFIFSSEGSWHYFKYSMGMSSYDDIFIPDNYPEMAVEKLEDVNFMKNKNTALSASIGQFFPMPGGIPSTSTVSVDSNVVGTSFRCYATYYKFPYQKGKRHYVTCFGTLNAEGEL